ncbi:putative oxidoreductase DltE [Colletotrichum trifolii]|uniref:Putative oxidoreductase DltE n=1 Tax=Colletotrichum trifolii TaxID=5466 RepID=A0A4R8RDU2_COLTR|nr:putative oxidoreductase DltE [Colletotrichum trifolii]
MPFNSQTALVTGATSGIGLALAERLIANGTFVIAVGRRRDRLEALVATHGADKVAAEPFDMTDLAQIEAWANKITSTYPSLSTLVLNAGVQHSIDFTSPTSISLPQVSSELTTNYLAPIHLITHFLPHLQSLPVKEAHVILVSSGLALVPTPRCPNYCATKAALHSLTWSLRTQLADDRVSSHIRVIEIMPPAVQTELHSIQPDLVAAGQADIGITLDDFTEETWTALEEGKLDEVIVGPAKNFAHVETDKRTVFDKLAASFKADR